MARAREFDQRAQRRNDVLLIDTRSPAAFEQGHIPGARNIRLGDLQDERTIQSLEPFGTLVVYGENPGDNAARAFAKSLLAEKRLEDVYLFTGGIEAWAAAGYELAGTR